MFYVLKVYWFSRNYSCGESSSPFEHAKNWSLKRRLNSNLYQLLIDVKYTRHWHLGLKENLSDSVVVKPIIFATQKKKFSVVKNKTTYFLKNYVASLFKFFEKIFPICKFFTTRCWDVWFWDLLYFICLKFNPKYW